MAKGWLLALFMVFGVASCAQEKSYPYVCHCECNRCIVHDPQTGQCQTQGRESFSSAACATTDVSAGTACTTLCNRFGSECNVEAGRRGSNTPCG
jgi:hypothetical protein